MRMSDPIRPGVFGWSSKPRSPLTVTLIPMLLPMLLPMLMLALMLTLAPRAIAEPLRPLVLAYATTGSNLSAVVEDVSARLTSAGFSPVGRYRVSAGAEVIVATSPELLRAAQSAERSAYIAPLRVAVTQVGSQIQVSYLNLEYFRYAYQVPESLLSVMRRLQAALGAERSFGAAGVDSATLSRYRYAFGMERFTDPWRLAEYPSQAAAVAAVNANIARGAGGVTEIYRIDLPARNAVLIGLAIDVGRGADEEADDRYTLGTVDVRDPRHTAYLPYEILIQNGKVEALHMRFRMALHFPDLRMMGENSFVQLRRSPAAVERVLTRVAGG
jgi:hypothetical protein